ncbi:MAG: hypothetical protein FD143_2217 [Ignavibacteria bacterium]|nr:MAG: hypothetical protein FD143_2217 [Ignavibacteria bacterium]KAF0158558.1 MAG: hypothetical protein FD188_2499 [Ignavibacteria bacterium]
MSEEKFLRYFPERDAVFILGAGTSNPDGVPLQKEMLPMIMSREAEEICNSEIGKIVIEFIIENFHIDVKNNLYPQLEAVFGFIDYFIQQDESLNAKYTNEKIRDIKEYFIKILHFVVNIKTNQRSPYYHKFWEAITKHSTNTSIITLNYDTLLEQAFDFLFQKKAGYIDYCIPLMNYEKHEQLKGYNFWVNPREPVMLTKQENPFTYKIIKTHGSLTWKYCNCCNQTLLTPWDRKIDLNHGKFLGYSYPENEEYEYRCPIDGTEFQTLIMPPSYLKALHHPIISLLLSEAAREIRAAKKIIFIGYSLSNADVHVKALFKKQITEEKQIIVINHKQKAESEMNYRSLTKNVRFIYEPFEKLVNNDELLSTVF